MYLVLDTETTGLPTFNAAAGRRFPSYTNTPAYETCRIVSISWLVVNDDHTIASEYYAVVYPDNFIIPAASQAIHGISTEQAQKDGVPFIDVVANLYNALRNVDTFVAHNAEFDVNVLASELYRRGYYPITDDLLRKKQVCTMLMGKEKLNLVKRPKLCDLYQRLYGTLPEGTLHNAAVDTKCCYMCYCKLAQM
jgi:DNA polymerase III epsilon subunit-like protein